MSSSKAPFVSVILTSDGVNESTDRSCEEFGARRLRHLAVKLAHRPAQELADELLRSTARHEQGACNVQDDRTVVVLKVL